MAPAGGKKPVFGTNPIAFSWPRPNTNPFVFDFATSAIARGDIELLLGALIGDLTSAQSLAFDAGAGATPCHGELILAFDPKVFLGDAYATSLQQAEALFESITEQGARLPS